MTAPLRIGILGAARIAPMALIRPARNLPEVRIAAVAARDPERARKFAGRHGLERVHDDYAALLEDPDLDAIYNPLPNGLHCEWTIRALEAGKHVLCEKPLASNAAEAQRMAEAAEKTGNVLMEAFHWRYHPLAERARQILDEYEIGRIRHVETAMCVPLPFPGDIRYRLDLAGGATMDTGCYAIHMMRFFAAEEPEEVMFAQARLSSPGVDRAMQADFRFPSGATGTMRCSLFSARLAQISARIEGERGTLKILNPVAPHVYHRMTLVTPDTKRVERVKGDSTYTHQLRAFAAVCRGEGKSLTDGAEGIRNMQVIDAVYEKAGLGRLARPQPL